jgi:general secretion pathway protein G
VAAPAARPQLAQMMTRDKTSGFSIAELITVVAIIGILASIALPVTRVSLRREKEIELRRTLRKIHEAIDRYEDLRVMGMIKDPPHLGQETYPRSLEELVKGVELMPSGTRVRFLRQRDLIDPMTGRAEWRTLSDSDDPGTVTTDGNNVFEVHSTSTALALDGKTRYSEW